MRQFVENKTLFKNPDFWAFYVLNSCGEIGESFDFETVKNIFKTKKDSFENWLNSFTGFYKGIFEDSDGDVENPSSVSVSFNNNTNLIIEFHAGDTYCYLENESLKEFAFIGNSGGHWSLPIFRWSEALKLAESATKETKSFVLLLLLPCVWITKEDDFEEVIKSVSNAWLETNLVDAENCNYLAEYWCNGVDARKDNFYWYQNDQFFWVTNAEWSSRCEKLPEEEINKITKLLSLACDK